DDRDGTGETDAQCRDFPGLAVLGQEDGPLWVPGHQLLGPGHQVGRDVQDSVFTQVPELEPAAVFWGRLDNDPLSFLVPLRRLGQVDLGGSCPGPVEEEQQVVEPFVGPLFGMPEEQLVFVVTNGYLVLARASPSSLFLFPSSFLVERVLADESRLL